MGAKRLRVLLAEDEPIIAWAFQETLEAAGHEVTLAADGLEALAAVASDQPFDALVTDLNVPRLGGETLIRRLRADRPGLPILVVTGSPPRGGVHPLWREGEGPLALLVKPVGPDEILAALHCVTSFGGQDVEARSLVPSAPA